MLPMSFSMPTLLIRNLHDVFGENDPTRGRAAIDEIFTEDCVFYEPRGVYRGRDEIDRVAGTIEATHPAKAGGRSGLGSMKGSPRRFFPQPYTRASVHAVTPTLPTEYCQPFGFSSAATSNSNRARRELTMANSLSDALVFFGATGDLAFKQIFPVLQVLVRRGHLDHSPLGQLTGDGDNSFVAISAP